LYCIQRGLTSFCNLRCPLSECKRRGLTSFCILRGLTSFCNLRCPLSECILRGLTSFCNLRCPLSECILRGLTSFCSHMFREHSCAFFSLCILGCCGFLLNIFGIIASYTRQVHNCDHSFHGFTQVHCLIWTSKTSPIENYCQIVRHQQELTTFWRQDDIISHCLCSECPAVNTSSSLRQCWHKQNWFYQELRLGCTADEAAERTLPWLSEEHSSKIIYLGMSMLCLPFVLLGLEWFIQSNFWKSCWKTKCPSFEWKTKCPSFGWKTKCPSFGWKVTTGCQLMQRTMDTLHVSIFHFCESLHMITIYFVSKLSAPFKACWSYCVSRELYVMTDLAIRDHDQDWENV
jgi:hypothetical protein